MKISVIVPTFNEEKCISNSLKRIDRYLKNRNFKYEIIIVDDGSKDKTLEKVKGFINIKILKNKKNMGKGYSVKKGVEAAKMDWILFSDADLSTPIEELDKFILLKDKYDILIGSRNLKESSIEVKQPFFRVSMGKLFAFLVRLFFLKDIKDSQCGFKFFRKDVAKKIFKRLTVNRFSFDVEILLIGMKLGYKIKEVPVRWLNREKSKVRLFSDPIKMVLDLINLKLRKI